jgi:FixJ family two-component response regulator
MVMTTSPQRALYAASKSPEWLSKVSRAAEARRFRFQAFTSVSSLLEDAATRDDIACLLLDSDPRIQPWSRIQQTLYDKRVIAPVVLVTDESSGIPIKDIDGQIAHVRAFHSMDVPEIVETIQDAIGMSRLVAHQFEVLRCHRLYQSLPARQRLIVDYAVEGAPNKQIATKLNVSVKTIERERQRAYRQLNVRSTAEMTRVVIMGGLHGVVFPAVAERKPVDGLRLDSPRIGVAPVVVVHPTSVISQHVQG